MPRIVLIVTGALVIAAIVWTTFLPALQIGFWFDDYSHLESTGRPTFSDFVASNFIPNANQIWYRPIQQLQWRVEYELLGSDAFWYHVVQNGIHLANCLLLYSLVARLSRNWRVGFTGALVYSVLPAYAVSVFWLATPDPLAGLFYLAAIRLWVSYLEKGGRLRYAWVVATFVLGLLTKEVDVTLPITLVLVDRWLIARPASAKELLRRDAPFFAVLPIWAFLEWNVIAGRLATGTSRGDWLATARSLAYYVGALTIPWSIDSPIRFVGLLALVGLVAYAAATRNMRLLFLAIVGPLSVLPMASPLGVSARYLYIPLMATAVVVGFAVDGAFRLIRSKSRGRFAALLACGASALLISFIVVSESEGTAGAAENFTALARQTRLKFRPVFDKHVALSVDTLLYFVEPPFSSYNVSGMMFLRYGPNVTVEGNDVEGLARLRDHAAAFVFYPGEQDVLSEQRVDPSASAVAAPNLPVRIGNDISLGGFEVVNTTARPGEAIVLLLYLRGLRPIAQDYTVFAHLMDGSGSIVAGYDSQPRRGAWPTSKWLPDHLVEDAVILPITPDVPAGSGYRLQVGLYYLPTMERLPVVQPDGKQSDAVEFRSFTVEP